MAILEQLFSNHRSHSLTDVEPKWYNGEFAGPEIPSVVVQKVGGLSKLGAEGFRFHTPVDNDMPAISCNLPDNSTVVMFWEEIK